MGILALPGAAGKSIQGCRERATRATAAERGRVRRAGSALWNARTAGGASAAVPGADGERRLPAGSR
jgi:hypothetical protein